MEDVVFDVVGHSKTDKLTKEGHRETTFKVQLKSTDGKMKLSIVDSDAALIQKYPLTGEVPLKIGACTQVTLSQIEQNLKDAAEAADEEKAQS
jgi:hypothetical protein